MAFPRSRRFRVFPPRGVIRSRRKMIILKRDEDCCGCRACETVCPATCIAMREDGEGFLYPHTDLSRCIDCHLCERACPIINSPLREAGTQEGVEFCGKKFTGTFAGKYAEAPRTLKPPASDFLAEPRVFAARCRDADLLQKSASGGAFTILAESVIADGGVVFGARWNADFTEAVHDRTDSVDGLAAFRGSKYLQSDTGKTFAQTLAFLRAGRRVMYTGTPCEIAGLRRALRRDFPNLLLVDIACHSTPSPKVWRAYWSDLRERRAIPEPSDVRFRKKVFKKLSGVWTSANFAVETPSGTVFQKSFYQTPFGRGFGRLLFSRPSCSECPAHARTSGSDITIGDFWGAQKYFPGTDVHAGTSVVICNTERGNAAFEAVRGKFSLLLEATYAQAERDNGGLKSEMHSNAARADFFEKFNAAGTPAEAAAVIRKFTKVPFPRRVRGFAFRCARLALSRIPAGTRVLNFFLNKKSAKKILGK